MSLSLWIILLLQTETVISTELNHVAMIKNKKGQDKLKYLRAMRDAEEISSRLLRKRVLDICCSSLPSNIFPWAPSAEYNARCPYMSPVSWQHSAMGPLYNLHTSPFIHKNKNLAQDQPDGRKSSVDAHGVSSCLGCSRILRHLISFLTSSQDFRSRKKPWDKKFQPHLRTRPVKTVHTIHERQTHYTPR